jgi:predicted phage-related endonuclease
VFTDGEREVFGSVISGLGGIEIKTTTERNHEFREDEVPDSYYCQVQHYMAVTGLEWFILVVMIGKVDGRGYVIRRDDAFIPGMIEAESHFWFDNVCRDIPPPPTGNERESELLNSLYESSGSVSLPDEYEEKLREYEEIAEKIRELKTRQEIIKEEIKLAVSGQSDDGTETEKVTAKAGGYTVVWSKQTRRVVDTAALRKANLFDSYSKESTSFVMRIRGAKEKE